jgi:hypothetical protein
MFTVAARDDGTVVAWGQQPDSPGERVPGGLTDVVEVSAGAAHVLALRSDGTVAAWGSNYAGQTDVPSGLDQVVAVAAGWSWSMALKVDGTVVSWGTQHDGTAIRVPHGLHGVTDLAAGGDHALAVVERPACGGWPALAGYPDMSVGAASVIYLWHDGDGLRLRSTRKSGGRSTFTGTLTTNGAFQALERARLEGNDRLTLSPDGRRLTFRFVTTGALDGFDVQPTCDATWASVSLRVDGRRLDPAEVHLGRAMTQPATVPFTSWSY